MEKVVAQAWPGSRVFTSSIKTNDTESVNVQGIVCLIVSKKWEANVSEHGSNSFGWWVWATISRLSGKKVTVISTYHPNVGSVISGSETVWHQQYDALTREDAGTEVVGRLDPEKKCSWIWRNS